MSIIVVVKKLGKVVIAADTLCKFGETKVTRNYRNTDKIISFNDSFIGITGTSAHLQVFRHLFNENANSISLNS